MSVREPLVVIAPDPALRSGLVARLSLAGEAVIVARHRAEPSLDRVSRQGGTLVVDSSVLPSNAVDRPEDLHRWLWPGKIVVLMDAVEDIAHQVDSVLFVEKSNSVPIILDRLARWRGQ